MPDLPSFEFEYQNEIDLFNLQQNLSEESLETLNDIYDLYHLYEREGVPTDHKGDATKSSSLRIASYNTFAGFETFTDLTTNLNSIVSINNDIILNNTVNQQPSAISLGGVIIPSSNTLPSVPFKYQICPRTHNRISRRRVSFDVSFDVPDTSWQVLSVETKYLITDRDEKIVTDFTPSRNGNTIFFNSLLYNEYLYSSILLSGSLKYISLTVTFSNGAIKTFKTGAWNSTNCFFGNFLDVKGTNDTGGGNNDTVNLPENTFVPTGFGVKQIGIADYKKVEQSLQGYVEGDVSHIENIMAREYKEKATRRLRRSENTTTTSSETEREQLTDTTSANRFEMQSEVASVIQESKDFSASANVSYSPPSGNIRIDAGAGFASHSSKEDSNRQAITQAKDITERAMERVVSKVKEERIQKIVEEFSEENTHGFDNRKGDNHVVGVYRWVDKVYKNQVINYGKRLMFEFMVPEPAKLHLLGMAENKSLGTIIEKPTDPRNATAYKLSDYSFVNETTIKYWGGKFNVELPDMPLLEFSIGKSLGGQYTNGISNIENMSFQNEIQIPEGYIANKGTVAYTAASDGDGSSGSAIIGDAGFFFTGRWGQLINKDYENFRKPYSNNIPISGTFYNQFSGTFNFSINVVLTNEAKEKWQKETFKAIIDAYNEALIAYNQLLAEEKAKGDLIKGTNPGFYRQIENKVLRKNCISYLVSQNQKSKRTYGRDMILPLGKDVTRNFGNHEINVSADLDDYAAFAKFIEQAFEWDIMSYNFYPYYWGKRDNWASLYQYDNNDPLFRSFMQSGMARVIVTVRPGFEEAVNYYMQTGQIWNGGEVPVIEDELFLSIVDELQQPVGKKEGKAWPTRIPTSLTILQADSIGLKVTKALPYDSDLSDFENPDEVPQPTGFEVTGSQLNTTVAKFIQFTFEEMDGGNFRTIGDHDNAAQFPRVYECMGQTITINRDAKWLKTTPSVVIFDELAEQLSLLNGVKATVAVDSNGSTDGITFTVDTNKIKDFTFKKPGLDPLYDSLRVIIEDEVIVKIGKYDPTYKRIHDKAGVALNLSNTTNLFPISRFEI
ncbi:MAG: hypothetical protein HC854_03990 [Flavobacterium sp.]|nr:hypothetical protein [Flavobacterium sp.]